MKVGLDLGPCEGLLRVLRVLRLRGGLGLRIQGSGCRVPDAHVSLESLLP